MSHENRVKSPPPAHPVKNSTDRKLMNKLFKYPYCIRLEPLAIIYIYIHI